MLLLKSTITITFIILIERVILFIIFDHFFVSHDLGWATAEAC